MNKRKLRILNSSIACLGVCAVVFTASVFAATYANVSIGASISFKATALIGDVYLSIGSGSAGGDNTNPVSPATGVIGGTTVKNSSENSVSAESSGTYKGKYHLLHSVLETTQTSSSYNIALTLVDANNDGFLNLDDTFVYTFTIVNNAPVGGRTIYGTITLGNDTSKVSVSASSSSFTILPNSSGTVTVTYTIIDSTDTIENGYINTITSESIPSISFDMTTTQPSS